MAIAGLTFMIWTHLTTLEDERKYIWNYGTGVTLNKTLFCVVRYFTTLTILLVLFESRFVQFLAHIIVGFTASVSCKTPRYEVRGLTVV